MFEFDWTKALIPVPYPTYNAISWVTVSLSWILLFITMIYHIAITVMWFIKDKHHVIHSQKHSAYLSSALLLISVIFCSIAVHMTYTETYSVSVSECQVVKYSTTTSYTSFKMMLYILLVSRVWTVYSDGLCAMAMTPKSLMIWTLIIILWTLTTNIINALTTRTVLLDGGKCSNEWSFIFLFSVVSLDIAAVVVFLYLFTKPLLVLAEKQRLCDDTGGNSCNYISLRRVALKQCILSMTASISTLIAGTFAFIFGMTQVFACLDVVISSICVILMYKWHGTLYRKLQCGTLVDCLMDKEELKILKVRAAQKYNVSASKITVPSQSPKSLSAAATPTSCSQTPPVYPYPKNPTLNIVITKSETANYVE